MIQIYILLSDWLQTFLYAIFMQLQILFDHTCIRWCCFIPFSNNNDNNNNIKVEGTGLASNEYNVDSSIQRLEDYLKNAEAYWLQPLETI